MSQARSETRLDTVSLLVRNTVRSAVKFPAPSTPMRVAETLMQFYTGSMRSSIIHTLPICCEVLKYLTDPGDRESISRQIEVIALSEPFAFRAKVMLASQKAMSCADSASRSQS